ncbi:FTR1 family iron permease [Methylocapsa aurea]|uniref:FTR1 family iron permease n=1 Tax=Methylocapsa aurea TaxID=663610 RepID=UPI00055C084E|nr:FTR1 family protein [Methylocapsa aurea]
MIGALIIVLREVIEAGLIVGIVLAVTKSMPGRMAYIAGGLGAGLLGAGVVAIFAGALSNAFEGVGQEIFNASILATAVIMLTWHNVWMARHGREISEQLRRTGSEVAAGSRSLLALAVVVGLAVLREGSEVVLFLYGVVISSGASGFGLFLGGLLGLLLGTAISGLTYAGLVTIPMRYLFRVTSLLIAFMAAGMAAQSVAFLEQADLATVLGRIVWNTSSILPDSGMIGRVLHTLLGYSDKPTELQLLAYVGTLAGMFGLMRLLSPPTKQNQRLATR